MSRRTKRDPLTLLRTIADQSVDSVMADPPFGLDTGTEESVACLSAWIKGDLYAGAVPGPEVWRECLRILKPGGYLVVSSGTKGMDMLSMAIRLAGFEFRDSVAFIEGTTSPMSPGWTPIILARAPLIGTVAENVLAHGVGGLNIDATRIVTADKLGGGAEKQTRPEQKGNEGWTRPWMENEGAREAHAARVRANVAKAEELGRWPANLAHDGSEQVEAAFATFGDRASSGRIKASNNTDGDAVQTYGTMRSNRPERGYEDGGTAARFFYAARGADPKIEFLRWLSRLVTPPQGRVLEPFGSAQVRDAVRLEGFEVVA